jgi:hypothetical protein
VTAPDDGRHVCPGPDCRALVDRDKLACWPHWKQVDSPAQNRVYRAWRRGAGSGTREHLDAMEAAIAQMTPLGPSRDWPDLTAKAVAWLQERYEGGEYTAAEVGAAIGVPPRAAFIALTGAGSAVASRQPGGRGATLWRARTRK